MTAAIVWARIWVRLWFFGGHRNKKTTTRQVEQIQHDATVCGYLLTAKLLYMFRAAQHPSSGVHKTVVAACSTDHTVWGAGLLKRDQIMTPYLVTFEQASSNSLFGHV